MVFHLLLYPILGVVTPTALHSLSTPQLITAVELRSDAELPRPEDLRALVALQVGEPMSEDAVRRTLRNLFVTGVATEVEIYSRPSAKGVVAVVVLWAAYRVEEVALSGNLGVKEARLRRVIEQRERTPLLEDRVVRGLYRLQDLYREQGYLNAKIRISVELDEARKAARVVYHIDSDSRAKIAEVQFEGQLGSWKPSELLEPLRARTGEPYRGREVSEDAERLQQWLVSRGYRRARVLQPREEINIAGNEVRVSHQVEVGEPVEVVVEGADLDRLKKAKLLPFLEETGYDEAQVLQSMNRIRSYYQARGHYQVEIRRHEERLETGLKLVLEIEPGPEFSFDGLRFTGNEEVPEARLMELVETSRRRMFVAGSGKLVDEVLESDLRALRSFYAFQGYEDTKVGPARVEVTGGRLSAVIPIREGHRRRVAAVSFDGFASLPGERWWRDLPLRAGGPYHPRLVEDTLVALRTRFEDEGFDRALISWSENWNEGRSLVDIEFRARQGLRTVADRVVVRGGHKTRFDVIRRTAAIHPGEPLSSRRLLEAQRRLYQLGIFSRVDVDLGPLDEDSGARDVLVRVEEGRRRRLGYGLGYDSEDGIGGLLSVANHNLGGRGATLQLDLRASQREQRFRLFLNERRVGGWNAPITYTLFGLEEERVSFESRRFGTQVELVKPFRSYTAGAVFEYRVVENRPLAEDPGDIDRQFQEVQISSITPLLLVDRRDDPLDPARGWMSLLQAEYAFPFLGTDVEFLKGFLQSSAYLNLDRFGVLAGSVRIGAIEPLASAAARDPVVTADLPSALIPISERFFAGGRTTHRAYERDRLGIAGETIIDGVEVGGNGLLLVNLDYRFPIVGEFGGTVFYDLGNVWADWRNINGSELKAGAGIGFRYLSPIGPLRLDVGWKLEREPEEDPIVLFLSFGNPF